MQLYRRLRSDETGPAPASPIIRIEILISKTQYLMYLFSFLGDMGFFLSLLKLALLENASAGRILEKLPLFDVYFLWLGFDCA